jgi:hypothetical protein
MFLIPVSCPNAVDEINKMQARMLKRVKTGSNLFIVRALGKNKNLVYKNKKNLIYS